MPQNTDEKLESELDQVKLELEEEENLYEDENSKIKKAKQKEADFEEKLKTEEQILKETKEKKAIIEDELDELEKKEADINAFVAPKKIVVLPKLEAVVPEELEVSGVKVEKKEAVNTTTHIFGLRTTANREDQVMSFLSSNVTRKKIPVYSIIRPHGMRGYIFLEAESMQDAEAASFGVPYARGILPKEIGYHEIEHMLERVKKDINIQKNDIAEIISGPFKREKAKITRVDKSKEEVVVELLEAAVPIPITVKIDAVKVIRRDTEE